LEINRLRAIFHNHKRVAFDTYIFIYQWEANPRYSPLTDLIFSLLEQNDFVAITSTITMTELLVHPYRNHDLLEVNNLVGLLSTYPNLEWKAPHLAIAARAAEIRAQHGLHTPDALQAATAIHANATAFFTNDPIFARIPEFKAIVLDRFL
jgi:predicted nucleic acid-binding protein